MRSPAPRLADLDEPTPDMVDAAIAWALRVHYATPDGQTRQALQRWLDDDPRHATAWSRMSAITGELRDMPPGLARGTLQPAGGPRAQQRRAALKSFAVLGIAGLTGWAVREHAPWQRLMADASTATGEVRTIILADGTTVALNTDTALSTHLTMQARDLRLHRGEIFVTTGRDAAARQYRPLRVQTAFGNLQAMGTQFLMRLEADAVRVAVREGAVELQPAHGARRILAAGEQWRMDAAAVQPVQAMAFEPSGWVNGVLVARGMRLADLLAELGRYRSGFLGATPDIADVAITGIYQLHDIDQTLHFLARTQGWQLKYRSRFWVTLASA